MEKFKSKKQAQEAFEKEGIEYPTFASGTNKGKIKGTLDELTNLYNDALKSIKNVPVESSKPIFHRGKPKKFNSFLFKKQ
jgi:hypothetical protein